MYLKAIKMHNVRLIIGGTTSSLSSPSIIIVYLFGEFDYKIILQSSGLKLIKYIICVVPFGADTICN